jgi:hypothetical protein
MRRWYAKTVKTKQSGRALFYSSFARPSALICLAGVKWKTVHVYYMKIFEKSERLGATFTRKP